MGNLFLAEVLTAFPNFEHAIELSNLKITNTDNLPSWFEVSELASASIACAGLMACLNGDDPTLSITVDQRLASFWFNMTLQPIEWELPPAWDPIAGDYRTSDGWIRLHTNAPHHRLAALSVLGDYQDRETLAPVISGWKKDELETAVVAAGGCAAVMRSLEEWETHGQGKAVASEPLIDWQCNNQDEKFIVSVRGSRPLSGIKVLDLTRVLAGPVATRFLSGYGADVLRIDPLDWEEPGVIPEVTLGKRCAGLDLKSNEGRDEFSELLKDADILVHGYRPDALGNLGFGRNVMNELNPALIDISLCAYGWTGPWAKRRGFDSLMQMSSGVADYGMKMSSAEKPMPLPVQALDHATGYFMAAAALYALHRKRTMGEVMSARLSLARTAHLLVQHKRSTLHTNVCELGQGDFSDAVERTDWGDARRVRWPLELSKYSVHWPHLAGPLRTCKPHW